jgi:hypothetical protein
MAKLPNGLPKTIAPLLADGSKRESVGHGLPPNIKRSLQMRAFANNTSMAWEMEQMLIEAAGLQMPEYRPRRRELTKEEENAIRARKQAIAAMKAEEFEKYFERERAKINRRKR